MACASVASVAYASRLISAIQTKAFWASFHPMPFSPFVTFPFEVTDLAPVFALEDTLSAAIEAVYAAIAPVLAASPVAGKGIVTRRYGPPDEGVSEVETPVAIHQFGVED